METLKHNPRAERKWRSALSWQNEIVVSGAGHCCTTSCCWCHSWSHMSSVMGPAADDEEL